MVNFPALLKSKTFKNTSTACLTRRIVRRTHSNSILNFKLELNKFLNDHLGETGCGPVGGVAKVLIYNSVFLLRYCNRLWFTIKLSSGKDGCNIVWKTTLRNFLSSKSNCKFIERSYLRFMILTSIQWCICCSYKSVTLRSKAIFCSFFTKTI